MKKVFLFSLLFTVSVCMAWANNAKETNMGGEIDIYATYTPTEKVTLFLGEEISFANFLTPENGLFDACNTVIGATYTPHPNIALEAAYEFLYTNATSMEHVLKLSAMPQVALGDFSLSLQETGQMTYATPENAYSWQLVSKLTLSYAIPNTPLSPYAYVEMTNPLASSVTEPVEVPAKEQSTPWYDELCYRAGLDWAVNQHNTLGLYYEFSHTPDTYFHLIGIGYTLSF